MFNFQPFVDKMISGDEKHWDVLIKYIVATNEDIWELYLSVKMMNQFNALDS